MNNNFRKLLNGNCIEKTFHLKNRNNGTHKNWRI